MKRFNQIYLFASLFFVTLLSSNITYSQCSFTGLDPTYCIDDLASELTGTPAGGEFSGPGIIGTSFNPSLAGVGVHTITYTLSEDTGDKYYLKKIGANPWGSTTNNSAMDNAFGPGGWILDSFEGATPASVFSPATSFVFLDGSDSHATELNTFLIANLPAIEAWVLAGGSLLINAAPNEGGDMDFGFGGTTLNYPSFENTVNAVDVSHPAFLGPLVPTSTTMTGTWYSHARILGAGYTNVLVFGADVVLCEKPWGAGTVMMGGMTTTNWHAPAPNVANFRSNIFTYLNDLAGVESCVTTQEVEVFALPVVTATADEIEICVGETVTLTGGGADTYDWDLGVSDGVAFEPPLGTTTYTVIGTDLTSTCTNFAEITITVHELPIVTAMADPMAICLGEDVIFTGGGADTYTWDLGVINGVPFTPAAAGTVTYTVTGTLGATTCENTATVDVTVFDNPVVTATATPDEICLGEGIIFTGGGADTYTWDGGVIDGVLFEPAAAGTFTFNVTGTDAATTCENTASVDVIVNDLPIITATASEAEICAGEEITLTGGGGSLYEWDIAGAVDGVAFTPMGEGTIDATVTGTESVTGCVNTASVSFIINPIPNVEANATTTEVCFGESVTLSGSGADMYVWSPAVPDGAAFTPTELGDFTYTVTGSSGDGCSASASITISVIDCEPVVAGIDLDDNICIGDCIEIVDASDGPAVEWAWDFGVAADPTTSSEQNPVVCFNTLGVFEIQLTITSPTGATSSTSKLITINDNPTVITRLDTIIDLGGNANLIGTSTSSGTYVWSPDDAVECLNCPITTASPKEDVTYTVLFMDENGCTDQDTVMVLVNFVEGIGVPTAFSPNGDGNNDILFVKGYSLEAMSFTIYNRYGQEVFQSADQNIGWDGTYKNKQENPGVFTWVLHYNLITGKKGTLKGNTTLIR